MTDERLSSSVLRKMVFLRMDLDERSSNLQYLYRFCLVSLFIPSSLVAISWSHMWFHPCPSLLNVWTMKKKSSPKDTRYRIVISFPSLPLFLFSLPWPSIFPYYEERQAYFCRQTSCIRCVQCTYVRTDRTTSKLYHFVPETDTVILSNISWSPEDHSSFIPSLSFIPIFTIPSAVITLFS